MRSIRLLKEDKGFMSHFVWGVALFLAYMFITFSAVLKIGSERVEAGVMSSTEVWLLAIAVSTFPIWAAALYGGVAVLVTRKDISFYDYAFDAFTIILVGFYVLAVLGGVISWVVSWF